ncbi:hypothetical protein Nocox_36900 [Nonomuraea coxensis DSM 45129]|uniref:Uncharacterized protein n=1 Tax=Nonomuraea coxensis DSM 45129 TaxID=1122611 RepID=A0ABX8UDQ2_9ACTN|nr:hypothetical protein [Nonomuraea coxensis]QYC44934.1 hypothetical protein Nocox_36900 [Nonomuraea coxensis DSM 45129]
MADRSVSIRLQAETAAAVRNMKGMAAESRSLSVRLSETGASADRMRSRLEAATRALPKVKIDADSTAAELKFAEVRRRLESLSSKRIGIDVDSAAALAELRDLEFELNELATKDFDPQVQVDIDDALSALRKVDLELDRIGSRRVQTEVDVDTRPAITAADLMGSAFNSAIGVIGNAGPAGVAALSAAVAALPAVAGLAASGLVFSIGSALATVGFTAAATSDDVKHAWSETADAIKGDLADAAQPFAVSAVRASDVALRSFERLKPTLARIFADLAPDVDQFVKAVGDGLVRLGPGLEKIGDSFGTLLSSLSAQMPSIMGNLSDTFTTFGQIMDENPTMLADLLNDATSLLSTGAEVLSWADEIKLAFSAPLGPAGSEMGRDYFFEQMFGASLDEITSGMEEFPRLMGRFEADMAAGVSALRGLSGGGDAATVSMRNLKDSLEGVFDPASKALDAEIRLKEAIQRATEAASKDKLTGLERLQTLQQVTGAIADAARAESERTGKTEKSGQAFLDQLPKLQEWAGGNKAAQDTVAALGESLGITTMKTKDGIVAVDSLGNAIKLLPNGKKVPIDADTAKGKAELADFLLYVARQKGTIDVHVRTIYDTPSGRAALERKQNYARGGIAQNGVRLMASGGVLQPMITDQATYSPTNNAIFAEAGREAFIPYASQHRERASEVLARVADDFGYLLINKAASQTISGFAESVQLTADQYEIHLGGAINTLDAALGQSGSLTSAIGQVGTVGQSLVNGWETGSGVIGGAVAEMGSLVQVSVTGMADTMAGSINGLTGAVEQLQAAVGASLKAATVTKAGKSGVGATLTAGTIKRGSSSGVGATLTSGSLKLPKVGATLTSGSVPLQPEKVVLNPSQYGLSLGGGGVSLANTARVSAPQQAPSSYTPASSSSPGGLSTAQAGAAAAGGSSSPAVVIQEQHIYQDADADRFAESAAMRVRGRGR